MKLLLILLFAFTLQATSQTVINYQTWTAASGCNIFSASTTINNIVHQSTIGQPTYDATNHAVSLTGQFNPSTMVYTGTEYRIAYNFKVGYTYSITVNAQSITNQGIFPFLRLRLTGSTSASTSCSGAQTIDKETTGNLTNSIGVGNTAYVNYAFDFGTLSNAVPYLTVALVPVSGGGFQTILIRSITITETAPAGPKFALSPISVSKICGTALTTTFTVNNVNNTPGVTGYVWNLGSTANGWTYNGGAAGQFISTPTNTLTLTAAACVTTLQNVTATANIGSTGYTTNTATVVKSNPPMTLSGVDPLCTTGTFSVSGVPCSSTISWVSSNTNVVTVPASGNSVTATKVNAGNATITATVNSCGQPVTLSKTIHVGGYSSGDYVLSGPSFACPFQTLSYSVNILPGATGYTWIYPSNFSYNNGGNGSSYLTLQSGTSSSGGGVVGVRVANACDAGGSYSTRYVSVNSCGAVVTVSPNPTADNVTITMRQQKDAVFSKTKKASIYQIKVIDQLGTIRKQYKYSYGTSNTNISLRGLISGVFTIQVFDGTTWSSTQVIKQ